MENHVCKCNQAKEKLKELFASNYNCWNHHRYQYEFSMNSKDPQILALWRDYTKLMFMISEICEEDAPELKEYVQENPEGISPLFVSYVPSFASGFSEKEILFSDLDELLSKLVLQEGYFWCYSKDDESSRYQFLMQERKDLQEWWVIGFVYNFDLSKHLPKSDMTQRKD